MYYIKTWVETNGNDQQSNFFQKTKVFGSPNNKKWFKFNACEILIIIRKKKMIMNRVRYCVKYSMNKYINNLKKMFIYEITIYVYGMGRAKCWDVANVLNVSIFQNVLPNLIAFTSRAVAKTFFWQTSSGKFPVRP